MAEVVALVEAGQPWLVTIDGDPGIGKTSLARRCLAAAPGLRVLWARAAEAEADLDFGLVDQLLRAAGDVSGPVLAADGNGPRCLVVRRGRALARSRGGAGAAGAGGHRGR